MMCSPSSDSLLFLCPPAEILLPDSAARGRKKEKRREKWSQFSMQEREEKLGRKGAWNLTSLLLSLFSIILPANPLASMGWIEDAIFPFASRGPPAGRREERNSGLIPVLHADFCYLTLFFFSTASFSSLSSFFIFLFLHHNLLLPLLLLRPSSFLHYFSWSGDSLEVRWLSNRKGNWTRHFKTFIELSTPYNDVMELHNNNSIHINIRWIKVKNWEPTLL